MYNTVTRNLIGQNATKDYNTYCQILVRKTDNSQQMLQIHRLVLCCFFPFVQPYDCEYDVNHKNGVKSENFINPYNIYDGNLEWCTRQQNIIHAVENNLAKTGEDRSEAKITNEIAKRVVELLQTNQYTSKEIVEIIGDPNLRTNIVDSIRKKESWKMFSKGIQFNQRINRLFTEQDVHNFCKVFQELSTNKELGINDRCRIALINNGFEPDKRYVETLRKIYVKKYYPNITSQYTF